MGRPEQDPRQTLRPQGDLEAEASPGHSRPRPSSNTLPRRTWWLGVRLGSQTLLDVVQVPQGLSWTPVCSSPPLPLNGWKAVSPHFLTPPPCPAVDGPTNCQLHQLQNDINALSKGREPRRVPRRLTQHLGSGTVPSRTFTCTNISEGRVPASAILSNFSWQLFPGVSKIMTANLKRRIETAPYFCNELLLRSQFCIILSEQIHSG